MGNFDYPKEKLIELKSLSPYLVGRVTILKNNRLFDAQVDIIQSESGKIYNHVGRIFGQESDKEAFDMAFMKLKLYLSKK